jgi:hypothetical protein
MTLLVVYLLATLNWFGPSKTGLKSKSIQHLANFAHLNYVPLSVRTHLGTPNLKIILCRNLIVASYVMFTTGIASIHLVNVSIAMKRNLYPLGALGSIPMMLIPQIAKGQEKSMGRRGLACFVVYFWKNWQSLHLVTIFITSSLAVGQ